VDADVDQEMFTGGEGGRAGRFVCDESWEILTFLREYLGAWVSKLKHDEESETYVYRYNSSDVIQCQGRAASMIEAKR